MPKMEALLFDLDGTLVDTRADLAAAVNFALGRLGRPARTLEEVREFIGGGVRELIRSSLGPAHEDMLEPALALFRPYYLEHCADRSALYPGVGEALGKLAGPVAVVTNKPEAASRAIFRALGVEAFFRAVIGGDSLPFLKPRPEPLWEAARRLGARPERVLMVGDSPGDVQAGRAAGMRTCAVTYGYRPAEELRAAEPDFLLDRIGDLEAIIGSG